MSYSSAYGADPFVIQEGEQLIAVRFQALAQAEGVLQQTGERLLKTLSFLGVALCRHLLEFGK